MLATKVNKIALLTPRQIIPASLVDYLNNIVGAENVIDAQELYQKIKVPLRLSEINIPEDAIDRMAEAAMKVTRLLKNNPRELTFKDAKIIYSDAY